MNLACGHAFLAFILESQITCCCDSWPYWLAVLTLKAGFERREDIFSQVFTMIHIKSFVQNIQTKTEMEPHDQFWPSSCDTLILLDQFLLSWHSFLSCSISYVVSREGKCHLQPKIVHIIFKKARKRIQFSFVVRIGANEVRQTDKMGKAQKIQLYCFM